MARTIVWSEEALRDVDDIAAYIARGSRHYASTFVSKIFRAAEGVQLFAEAGAVLPEYERENIREIFVGNYRLIYRITPDEVTVLTVVTVREISVEHGDRTLNDSGRCDPPIRLKDVAMARQFVFRAFLTAATTVLAAPAFAHPGHGKDGGSQELTHYVTEPVHVAPLGLAALAGIAAAAFVAWYRRKA